MIRTYQQVPDFFAGAQKLRDHFEAQFKNPFEAHEGRFVWDPWCVPGQYNLLRTPAYHFFPEEIYQSFEQTLLAWGQDVLGCQTISPPWLSCYTEGHYQNLHADNPHGPWAYVYSLTPWNLRSFRGGETLLIKPEVLTYWESFDPGKGQEESDIFLKLAPQMNQLTVFDHRLPHGVEKVTGVEDPLKGRLVIHGWFTEPQPQVNGGLEGEEQVGHTLAKTLNPLLDEWESEKQNVFGLISLRLHITPQGQVTETKMLANSLRPSAQTHWVERLARQLQLTSFPKAQTPSEITLPLVFQ